MKRNSFVFIFLSVFQTYTLFAQTHISAFKNGTAFVVKEIQLAANKGVATLEEIPQATFGTLWFYAPTNTIKSVNSQTKELSKKNDVSSLETILLANVGKAAKITLKDNKSYEGTIFKMEKNILVFQTVSGTWFSLNPAQVELLELKSQPNMSYEVKQNKKVIEIELSQAKAKQSISMMYLQKGISWLPNYAIELKEDNKAKLVLRASLLNDSEDIENANIDFVVGIPNFAYTYLASPLVSSQDMMSFISTLNTYSNQPQGNRAYANMRRGDITTQSFANIAVNEDLDDFDYTPIELEGEQAEDLFFYKAQNISLKKGGRGLYDILVLDTEYEDIYEVNLTASTAKNYYSSTYATINSSNQVWHSIRLKNDSKLPWTTGTVLLTKQLNKISKPLSQDKLNYTPVGAKTKIKLTVSPSIVVKDSEKENSRVENKKKRDKVFYDLVTVESKIEVINYHNRDITLNIDRQIVGKPTECNEKWKSDKVFNQYDLMNERYKVEWEIPLKKGESKEITYQYEVYVQK